MSKVKEETQKILQRSPEYWSFKASVYLLISFIAIGAVMILDFFMRVWWLDLILYLVAFTSFDRAMFYTYSYGQSSLMFFWDELIVHYEDEKQNKHTAYLLSEKAIDNYMPGTVYFLTHQDGQIILNEKQEMFAFVDKDSAVEYSKGLEEDSMVLPLTLVNGGQNEQ